MISGRGVYVCVRRRKKSLRKLEKTQVGTLRGAEEHSSHFRVREERVKPGEWVYNRGLYRLCKGLRTLSFRR